MRNKIFIVIILLFAFFQFSSAANNTSRENTPDYFKNIGDSLLQQNKNLEAMDAYKKALALKPNMSGAYLGIGRVFARLKDYDNAIKHMELALKADENISKEVLPELIFLYLFKNDVKTAACLKKILEIDQQLGNNLSTQVFNARIYGIKESDEGLVVEHYFVDGSTNRVMDVAKKADSFINSGEFAKAVSLYKELAAKESLLPKEKAVVFHTMGMIYSTNLNKPQEGIAYLKQAVEFDSEEIAFRIGLVDAYRSLYEYSKALDEINKILALYPNSKYGLYFQGVIYFKTEVWEKAVESWDSLKKADEILFALIETEYDKAKNSLILKENRNRGN